MQLCDGYEENCNNNCHKLEAGADLKPEDQKNRPQAAPLIGLARKKPNERERERKI